MSSIDRNLQFCYDTILKEARLENTLVEQLMDTMLSAYTNNPKNLAVIAPTGEGKSYVVNKVADCFPKEDVKRVYNGPIVESGPKPINLSHKILILDTPKPILLNSLMPLFSHETQEISIKYAHFGRLLYRGWSAVIVVQCAKFNKPDFVVTAPSTSPEKYKEAAKLIGMKYGSVPEEYNEKVVSDGDKQRARQIIRNLKNDLLTSTN